MDSTADQASYNSQEVDETIHLHQNQSLIRELNQNVTYQEMDQIQSLRELDQNITYQNLGQYVNCDQLPQNVTYQELDQNFTHQKWAQNVNLEEMAQNTIYQELDLNINREMQHDVSYKELDQNPPYEKLSQNQCCKELGPNTNCSDLNQSPTCEESDLNHTCKQLNYNPRYEELDHSPRYEELDHSPRYEELDHNPRYEELDHNPRYEELDQNPSCGELDHTVCDDLDSAFHTSSSNLTIDQIEPTLFVESRDNRKNLVPFFEATMPMSSTYNKCYGDIDLNKRIFHDSFFQPLHSLQILRLHPYSSHLNQVTTDVPYHHLSNPYSSFLPFDISYNSNVTQNYFPQNFVSNFIPMQTSVISTNPHNLPSQSFIAPSNTPKHYSSLEIGCTDKNKEISTNPPMIYPNSEHSNSFREKRDSGYIEGSFSSCKSFYCGDSNDMDVLSSNISFQNLQDISQDFCNAFADDTISSGELDTHEQFNSQPSLKIDEVSSIHEEASNSTVKQTLSGNQSSSDKESVNVKTRSGTRNNFKVISEDNIGENLIDKNLIIDEMKKKRRVRKHRACKYSPRTSTSKLRYRVTRKLPAKSRRKEKELLSCSQCEYSSFNKSNFKNHLYIHSEERKFACSLCNYKGKQSAGLRAHLKVHSVEKPYNCNLCPYKSKRKQNLIQHHRTHSKIRPYPCTVCTYKSTTKQALQKHISKHYKPPTKNGTRKTKPQRNTRNMNYSLALPTVKLEEEKIITSENFILNKFLTENGIDTSKENSPSQVNENGRKVDDFFIPSSHFTQIWGVPASNNGVIDSGLPSESQNNEIISPSSELLCPLCDFTCTNVYSIKSHLWNHKDEDFAKFVKPPTEKHVSDKTACLQTSVQCYDTVQSDESELNTSEKCYEASEDSRKTNTEDTITKTNQQMEIQSTNELRETESSVTNLENVNKNNPPPNFEIHLRSKTRGNVLASKQEKIYNDSTDGTNETYILKRNNSPSIKKQNYLATTYRTIWNNFKIRNKHLINRLKPTKMNSRTSTRYKTRPKPPPIEKESINIYKTNTQHPLINRKGENGRKYFSSQNENVTHEISVSIQGFKTICKSNPACESLKNNNRKNLGMTSVNQEINISQSSYLSNPYNSPSTSTNLPNQEQIYASNVEHDNAITHCGENDSNSTKTDQDGWLKAGVNQDYNISSTHPDTQFINIANDDPNSENNATSLNHTLMDMENGIQLSPIHRGEKSFKYEPSSKSTAEDKISNDIENILRKSIHDPSTSYDHFLNSHNHYPKNACYGTQHDLLYGHDESTESRLDSVNYDTKDSEITISCKHCECSFQKKSSIVNHMRSHSKDVYKCSRCLYTFRYQKEKENHETNVHQLTHTYKCQFCDFQSHTENDLQNHYSSHIDTQSIFAKTINENHSSTFSEATNEQEVDSTSPDN